MKFLLLALIATSSPLLARAETGDILSNSQTTAGKNDDADLGDNQVLFRQDNGYRSCMKDCLGAHDHKWCDYECTMRMENQN